ncbi:hypothetical protein PL9631_1060280 [Planktothrix paucivesiculata PCC 9631]|uniref:Uncharacterized protein n=1 Tax=Planktothrix paucivesiculata PCC 9631 TaxID=671071 RepID=A0A7Z9BNI7_9CYAN|nr:hypothetical protein PL9631_1060280 [Planktothrix paucivesiculata PCC 9631]
MISDKNVHPPNNKTIPMNGNLYIVYSGYIVDAVSLREVWEIAIAFFGIQHKF